MKKVEHECVRCGLPCLGSACTQGFEYYYCDCCGKEVNELYDFEGEELCEKCLERKEREFET